MRNLISILILLLAIKLNAQDIHFSQYYMAPMLYNPAEAGNSMTDYRLSFQQRQQWRSVSKSLFTVGASFEANNLFPKGPISGVGINILNDRAGTGELNNFILETAISATIMEFPRTNTRLVLGVQPKFGNISINPENLTWDNQWNGSYFDPSLIGEDNWAPDAKSYFDANLGIMVSKFHPRESINYQFGAAIHNILKPNIGLMGSDIPLDRRLVVYANLAYSIYYEWLIYPRISYQRQGVQNETILGFDIANPEYKLGIYTRFGDALIIKGGLVVQDWTFGVSYDINYSNLNVASNAKGGLEIMAVYEFNSTKVKMPFVYCPGFL